MVDNSPVGQVTVTQTLINGGGTITVPVTVEADALGPISGSASLSVATAEAASVHDTTAYAPVGMAYTISNVGWAATGGVSPTNSNVQTFGAPLSATFATGTAACSVARRRQPHFGRRCRRHRRREFHGHGPDGSTLLWSRPRP